MENPLKRGLPLLLLLAATAAFGNYQSPISTPSKNILTLPSFQSQELEPRPEVLLVYDEQGTLDLIAYQSAESPLVRVFEPLACEASAESACEVENSGGWSQNRVTCRRGNKLHDGATAAFAGGLENQLWGHSRYYDPELGRFTQTDPMGYDDSMNLYQAFNQSPQNFGDPMGEFTIADLMRYAERYGEAIGRAAKKDTIYQAFKENKEAWPSLKPIPSNYWQIAKEEFIPDEFQSLNPFATYEAYKEREAELKKADVDLLAAQGEALSRRNKSGVMAAELQQEAAQKQYNIAAATHGINMLGWVSLGTAGLNKLYSPGAIGKIYKTGTIGETAAWEKSGQCVQCTNAAEALHPGSTHLRIELPRIGKHSILKVDEGLFYDETLRGNIGVYFGKPPIPEGKVYFTQEELDAITKMLLKWTK